VDGVVSVNVIVRRLSAQDASGILDSIGTIPAARCRKKNKIAVM
jgi:hypothetical protein